MSVAESGRSRGPVVYGSALQLAVMLESITRVIDSEPREVFRDFDVRRNVEELSGTIQRRVAEANSEASQ